jgi:hypothetical protein
MTFHRHTMNDLPGLKGYGTMSFAVWSRINCKGTGITVGV